MHRRCYYFWFGFSLFSEKYSKSCQKDPFATLIPLDSSVALAEVVFESRLLQWLESVTNPTLDTKKDWFAVSHVWDSVVRKRQMGATFVFFKAKKVSMKYFSTWQWFKIFFLTIYNNANHNGSEPPCCQKSSMNSSSDAHRTTTTKRFRLRFSRHLLQLIVLVLVLLLLHNPLSTSFFPTYSSGGGGGGLREWIRGLWGEQPATCESNDRPSVVIRLLKINEFCEILDDDVFGARSFGIRRSQSFGCLSTVQLRLPEQTQQINPHTFVSERENTLYEPVDSL